MRTSVYEDMPATLVGRAPKGPVEAMAPEAANDVVFSATLYPNRSLQKAGFAVVMAVVCGVNFIAGAYFFSLGAWPVLGFCGLDVALVYFAFKLSYRQGRLREYVHVTADAMTVSRISPAGLERRWRLQPYWAQVLIDDPVEHDSQLRIVSHGRTLILGSFLSPPERSGLAEALRAALKQARAAS
ncbi:MAG: DUF2244 domain-containing protein [Pseudomonadota bacterium]